MWVWLVVSVIIAALGIGLWHFAAFADRVEDDSAGMVDRNEREPYGTKWLSILVGTDNDHHGDRDHSSQ